MRIGELCLHITNSDASMYNKAQSNDTSTRGGRQPPKYLLQQHQRLCDVAAFSGQRHFDFFSPHQDAQRLGLIVGHLSTDEHVREAGETQEATDQKARSPFRRPQNTRAGAPAHLQQKFGVATVSWQGMRRQLQNIHERRVGELDAAGYGTS
jgi:hypothetical protein